MIEGALRAAPAFLKFARDKHGVERQAAHWEGMLKECGPHLPTETVLANLRNGNLVRSLIERVDNAYSVLEFATRQGHPVVCAIRAGRKWRRGRSAREEGDWLREPAAGISLTAVSADQIVARIDYPNGISPDSE